MFICSYNIYFISNQKIISFLKRALFLGYKYNENSISTVDREEKKTHEWPTPATTKKLELSMRFIYFMAKSNEDYAKTT